MGVGVGTELVRTVPSKAGCDVDSVLPTGGAAQVVILKVEGRPLNLRCRHVEVSVPLVGGERELEMAWLSEGVVGVVPLLHLPHHAVPHIVRSHGQQAEGEEAEEGHRHHHIL